MLLYCSAEPTLAIFGAPGEVPYIIIILTKTIIIIIVVIMHY